MTDDKDDKTLGTTGKKTLTLKPSGHTQGTVRQDMGRGRTNSVVVETVFSRGGLGRLTQNSVLHQDIPVVQGIVLIAALAFVVVNLAVDLIYPVLDPRVAVAVPVVMLPSLFRMTWPPMLAVPPAPPMEVMTTTLPPFKVMPVAVT